MKLLGIFMSLSYMRLFYNSLVVVIMCDSRILDQIVVLILIEFFVLQLSFNIYPIFFALFYCKFFYFVCVSLKSFLFNQFQSFHFVFNSSHYYFTSSSIHQIILMCFNLLLHSNGPDFCISIWREI